MVRHGQTHQIARLLFHLVMFRYRLTLQKSREGAQRPKLKKLASGLKTNARRDVGKRLTHKTSIGLVVDMGLHALVSA
jgi:hypothetical protein